MEETETWDEVDRDILEDIREAMETLRKSTGGLPLSAIVQFVDEDGRVWRCTCPEECEIHVGQKGNDD